MPNIDAVSAFEDNYIWMLRGARHAVAVDPGDAGPVLDYLERHGLELAAILVTHHHADHTGGIAALLAAHPVPVYGPWRDAPTGACRAVREGDTFELAEIGARFSVFDLPGHTRDHVGYLEDGAFFCGDTLFVCACGRLFEGTPRDALASIGKILALPPQTRLYCAHEYTLNSVRLARTLDPHNAALAALQADAEEKRAHHLPTVPSTVAQELATNPFCRLDDPAIRAAAEALAGHPPATPLDVFITLRRWRDTL